MGSLDKVVRYDTTKASTDGIQSLDVLLELSDNYFSHPDETIYEQYK